MPSGGGVQSVEALFLLLLVFVASFAAFARDSVSDCVGHRGIASWISA